MKCRTVIDPACEEEVIIHAHARTALVDEIEALVAGRAEELIGYCDNRIVPLSASEVICFSVEDGKLYAITGAEKLRLRMRLYQLEGILDASFVKINQSTIANIKRIERFEASIGGALRVVFENGHRDYVSRRQLKAVKERIGFRL